jgi:Arc/MetJ-type ribon-helix-helix transcriptional regulator
MGRIQVVLPDELEKELREEIFKGLGMKKGNMSLAIEEAIRMWIGTQRTKRSEAAKKAWKTRKESSN